MEASKNFVWPCGGGGGGARIWDHHQKRAAAFVFISAASSSAVVVTLCEFTRDDKKCFIWLNYRQGGNFYVVLLIATPRCCSYCSQCAQTLHARQTNTLKELLYRAIFRERITQHHQQTCACFKVSLMKLYIILMKRRSAQDGKIG